MNIDYEMIAAIAGVIFTGIAATWAGVSFYSWLKRPKFEIRFHGGETNRSITAGRNDIEVEFENKRPRPATHVMAYVMFPRRFTFSSLSSGVSKRITTLGGRFSEQPFIFNSNPVVLFREEALVLAAQVDVPRQAKGEKRYELHALIVCAEGTSKTEKLYLKPPKS